MVQSRSCVFILALMINGEARPDQPAATKPPAASVPDKGTALLETEIRPFLSQHCLGCHGEAKPKGGINLSKLQDGSRSSGNRRLWTKVKENVEGGMMPPEGRPRPAAEQVERVVGWINDELNRAASGTNIDPGRVTIRRLNRAEYNNTIRDLLVVDFRPADDFPSDDVGYGFDNIGDVLTIPPILMEKYLAAAEQIAAHAIVAGPSPRGIVKTWAAESLDDSAGGSAMDQGRILASRGEISVAHDVPRDGSYIIRVRAYGQQAGDEPARMAIKIDGKPLRDFEVTAESSSSGAYEHQARLRGGKRRLSAAFLNDYYNPDAPDAHRRDRNLVVETIEIEGPLHASGDPLPDSHKALIFRTPRKPEELTDCAAAVLGKFARRAYRRPVSGGELARLMRFVDLARENGDSFERGIQLAVEAALVSPQFLFRVELNRGRKRKGDESLGVALNPFEIASRLSYFLWSSMPDDRLMKLAQDGNLTEPDVLSTEVRRMLQDPRAQALVDNFADQWLQLRLLKTVNPDKERFPGFDADLRDSMLKETEHFFASVMREDRSILDFLESDYTYLNERLARHYGITGVTGDRFRRVRVQGGRRGGLITQASVLTVTSNPTRTSPVKRGRWVLEQVLGSPPPPPPPDVPPLDDDKKAALTGTLRQRMERHRADASCAVCHNRLDPPGFGLENYDAVGAWRDRDGGSKVDASGRMPSGEAFSGPGELKVILKGRKREFTRCLTEKLLTYALGRGIEDFDAHVVDQITDAVASDQYRFSRLILEIVKSDPFLKRRG